MKVYLFLLANDQEGFDHRSVLSGATFSIAAGRFKNPRKRWAAEIHKLATRMQGSLQHLCGLSCRTYADFPPTRMRDPLPHECGLTTVRVRASPPHACGITTLRVRASPPHACGLPPHEYRLTTVRVQASLQHGYELYHTDTGFVPRGYGADRQRHHTAGRRPASG